MKLNIRRVLALLLLLALSVGFGFAFDAAATVVERHSYPCPDEYAAAVRDVAARFALPEAVVWAMLCQTGGFESNAVNGDAIGLMQLTPTQFTFIRTELLGLDSADRGLLYDPAANLEAGCAYLSYLFDRYAVWDLTFAAYLVGTERVDAWLTNADLLDAQGILIQIPDADAREFAERLEKSLRMYQKLYFS